MPSAVNYVTSDAAKPLTNAALARHWECSAPYVTKLRRSIAEGGKAMPDFATLAEADAWRAINAPPRISTATASDSAKNRDVDREKIADSFTNTTAGPKGNGAAGGTETARGERSPANNHGASARGGAPPETDVIDVRKFITPGADFERLMIAQAEETPQVAHGLFLRACAGGNPAEISAANRNWHETAKSAYAVRSDFIALQERTGALISIDDVRDILGTELQAGRSAFLKLGERIASRVNPADPLLAKSVIDAAVDEVFRQLDAALERSTRELAQPKAS